MPIYEYGCENCGHEGEELQSIRARPLRKCPECGGRYRRKVSAPAFQFKGSGWYVTDYAKKGSGKEEGKESSSSDTASKASEGGQKDSAKGDSKKGESQKASKTSGD